MSKEAIEKALSSLRNHSFDSVKHFTEVLNELLLKEGVCRGNVITAVLPEIMFSEDGKVVVPTVIKCINSDYAYGIAVEVSFTLKNAKVVWRDRVKW